MQLFDNRKRNAKDGNGASGILMTFAEFEQELAANSKDPEYSCARPWGIPPANRADVYNHLQWLIFPPIDQVLAGLDGACEWDSIDCNKNEVFLKFKDYILALAGEQSLKATLRRLSYSINQGVLKLVRDRLETVRLSFSPSLQYTRSRMSNYVRSWILALQIPRSASDRSK